MRRALAALLLPILGCGRSGLGDELLVGPALGSSEDAGTALGDDGTVPFGNAGASTGPEAGFPSLFADAITSPTPGPLPLPSHGDASSYLPDGGCGPATCENGCCTGSGLCVDPPTSELCGGHGNPCHSCGQDLCIGVIGCMRSLTNCGPSNCPGCCLGAASCGEGTFAALACGHGGALCAICSADEQCRPLLFDAGGFCQASNSCSPSNCTGCCSDNVCAQGNQNIACGYGGALCAACGSATCSAGTCIRTPLPVTSDR